MLHRRHVALGESILSAARRQLIVARADVARFLVAFGIAPLVLLSGGLAGDGPPWSFVLTPSWSLGQLVLIALAGAGLGATSGRPAHGLAAVTLGMLLGLGVDLWWLAGFVKPYDQVFVSLLPQEVWRSDMVLAALTMLGLVSAGYATGAVAWRFLTGLKGQTDRPRPDHLDAVALGVAFVGGSLLAVGITEAAASSALVVPDGALIQTVEVSHGAITVDPAALRSGQWRFRCHFGADAAPEWARLVAVPEDGELDLGSARLDEEVSACGQTPDSSTWGTIGDLQPGRYVWIQFEPTETRHLIATSSPFVVVP